MQQTAVGNCASRNLLARTGRNDQERYDAAGVAALDDHGRVARAGGIGLQGNDACLCCIGRGEIDRHMRDAASGNGHDTEDSNESLPVRQRPGSAKDDGDHAAIEPDAHALVNGTSLAAFCRNLRIAFTQGADAGSKSFAARSAAAPPASWAAMNAGASAGRMPAKVFDSDRAIVTAGLANEVEAVNQ